MKKYLTVFRDKVAILYITRTLMKYLTVFKDSCKINFKDN